jgi:hypothetical protein
MATAFRPIGMNGITTNKRILLISISGRQKVINPFPDFKTSVFADRIAARKTGRMFTSHINLTLLLAKLMLFPIFLPD